MSRALLRVCAYYRMLKTHAFKFLVFFRVLVLVFCGICSWNCVKGALQVHTCDVYVAVILNPHHAAKKNTKECYVGS